MDKEVPRDFRGQKKGKEVVDVLVKKTLFGAIGYSYNEDKYRSVKADQSSIMKNLTNL